MTSAAFSLFLHCLIIKNLWLNSQPGCQLCCFRCRQLVVYKHLLVLHLLFPKFPVYIMILCWSSDPLRFSRSGVRHSDCQTLKCFSRPGDRDLLNCLSVLAVFRTSVEMRRKPKSQLETFLKEILDSDFKQHHRLLSLSLFLYLAKPFYSNL
ncbi:hypothetical protein BT96DRAFT_405878 [Gymnopus androsaceus JB14]|uniref:C2H2-type domain-containing protein n=1 Tax=Gymnopus androsaceus JB14 TaxID=1447944 RepID=A0A6A4I2M0_9AGAR|nr:hypothetical protein BT96DRAFT_405878 [Gymnopus androsaceus JB14]